MKAHNCPRSNKTPYWMESCSSGVTDEWCATWWQIHHSIFLPYFPPKSCNMCTLPLQECSSFPLVYLEATGSSESADPCAPSAGGSASMCSGSKGLLFHCTGRWPPDLDKVMMLRFGTVSSLQHLQKNPGQAARGVWCVWKWLPDGSDQVSGWRQREESGCFCKLIPVTTK